MSRILIIRLSALGDVAMSLPVIYPLVRSNPDKEFYLLSLPFHEKLLIGKPDNLKFISFFTKEEHKGIGGIFKLFRYLRRYRFTHVADLHSVLRSQILVLLFKCFSNARIASIDKERFQKWKLTRKRGKVLSPLKTTFERYSIVFDTLGFRSTETYQPPFPKHKRRDRKMLIGIAPFAKYEEKYYPIELMEEVVDLLSQDPMVRIYLFGGGEYERSILDLWAARYPKIQSMVGKLTLSDELAFISEMDVMLTMDSANMHLASLVGTRVISIWGATHPNAGFYGWGQRPDDAIQVDLPCRPCSVFGNKKCFRGDFACMRTITPRQIVDRIYAHKKKGSSA
ncbi:glycosyltransferase family 9 protein [Porphyromonadaceae bacterium]